LENVNDIQSLKFLFSFEEMNKALGDASRILQRVHNDGGDLALPTLPPLVT
jgi:hypothetical protein